MTSKTIPVALTLAALLLLAASAAGQQSDTARGPATARVTIEQFCDFECGFCAEMAGTLRELQERYPAEVRVVYRHFPIERHRDAPGAAEAAVCATEQGRFWEMHDRLYARQDDLNDQRYRREATALKLDVPRFMHCLNGGRGEDVWRRDAAEGRSRGATATPTLFVNGAMVEGARPVEELAAMIEQGR